MRKSLCLFFITLSALLNAQVQLGPCINTGLLPGNADTIQAYTAYIDTSLLFMTGGYQVGETVNDFTLFDINSNQYQLSQVLAAGKPVLLISGSYSCPAFRHSMDLVLPDIIALFDTSVIYLVVYQLEAHPVGPDYSPYSDTVWVTSQNYTDGVLIPQHGTYADRKNRAYQSEVQYGAQCPTLIDGPGNEFWSRYGPSPNNAYLITPDGWVFNKYGWFNNSKIQCEDDISLLLASVGIIETSHAASLVSALQNPGNSDANLISQVDETITVRVTNLLGQTVISTTLGAGESFRLGEALPAEGIYTIILVADDRSQIITFVKAH